MKAVLIEKDGSGAARPMVRDIPASRPGPREVLVRVRCAGMNRADLGLKTGHSPGMVGTGTASVAGLEMAGEVIECGRAGGRFEIGDRVMGMCLGAHAQQVCVDERLLMPVPDGMDWPSAASLPVAVMTAHDALVSKGRLRAGHNVLVQAASSAVGIIAVQMASALGAQVVIGTSTSADKQEKLRALGLVHVLGETGLQEAVMKVTADRGVDIIVDHLGGPALAVNMACAAVGARIISVGRMGGTRTELDMDLLALKRISLIGVTFRTRTADDVAEVIARMQAHVGPLLAAGRLRMPIDRTFPIDDVADAHEWLRARNQFGKVLLEP